MIPLTFKVPEALLDPSLYVRVGAIIKDRATGHIVGHIQELGGWKLLQHLPIPGANPLSLVTEGIQMLQLNKIQQTLNKVQTLATVGSVASVASLGVSIAGFAAVIAKLNRMEGKLDQVLAQTGKVRGLVERLHMKVDAFPMAALKARLESIAMANHYDESRRRTSLQDAIENLAELRHYYGALLADKQFCSFGTENLLAILDTQERLVAACEGELFAEFLLGGDPRVINERWKHQKIVFDTIAWQTPQSLYQLTEQGDRDAGVYMVTSPKERLAKVGMLADIRTESMGRLASLPLLASFLHERNITAVEYLQIIDEQEKSGKDIVFIDAREDVTPVSLPS
jgi:hypothetical protein